MKLNKKIFAGTFIIGAVISSILFYKSVINSIHGLPCADINFKPSPLFKVFKKYIKDRKLNLIKKCLQPYFRSAKENKNLQQTDKMIGFSIDEIPTTEKKFTLD